MRLSNNISKQQTSKQDHRQLEVTHAHALDTIYSISKCKLCTL